MTAPRFIFKLFGVEPAALSWIESALLLASFVATIVAVVVSCVDLRTYRGIDLRDRLVGSRVMLAGFDPYMFDWRPGMPEQWLDPIRGDFQLHRLTKTPMTLWLYAPLARLSHRTVRRISFALEWLALFLSVCMLVRTIPQPRGRIIFLICAVVFFVLSDFWRQHLAVSQIYVFQLLALSAAIFAGSRLGIDSVALGVILAILACFRPTCLLLVPAFGILRCWRSATGLFGTFAIVVAATVPFMNASTWSSYLGVADRFYLLSWNPEALPQLPPFDHAGLVEGEDFRIPRWERASSTVCELYRRLKERFPLPVVDLGRASKALLALSTTLLLLFLLTCRSTNSPRDLLVLLVVFWLDTEFLLPQRWGYSDIILLAPLALALPTLFAPDRPVPRILLLFVLGLLAGQMGRAVLSEYWSTVLRSWLVMLAMTWLAVTQCLANARISQTKAVAAGSSGCLP